MSAIRADQAGENVLHSLPSGLFRQDGVTIVPTTSATITGGYTANSGVSTATFTGGTGSTAYTIDGVVAALKALGLLAQ